MSGAPEPATMGENLSLFDELPHAAEREPPRIVTLPAPRARRSDPETSHLAAAQAGGIQDQHAKRIHEALVAKGPATIYEIAERTGLDHVQVARTTSVLGKDEVGLARVQRNEDGSLVKRPGGTGRLCRVWEAITGQDR